MGRETYIQVCCANCNEFILGILNPIGKSNAWIRHNCGESKFPQYVFEVDDDRKSAG